MQRRNFEVYLDRLSDSDEDDQEHEGEMGDFVAVATGMLLGRLLYKATQTPFLSRHRHRHTHSTQHTDRHRHTCRHTHSTERDEVDFEFGPADQVFPVGETSFMSALAIRCQDKITEALHPIGQLITKAKVGQPSWTGGERTATPLCSAQGSTPAPSLAREQSRRKKRTPLTEECFERLRTLTFFETRIRMSNSPRLPRKEACTSKDQHGWRTRRTRQAGCNLRAKLQNRRGPWSSTNETMARRRPPFPANGAHSDGELAGAVEGLIRWRSQDGGGKQQVQQREAKEQEQEHGARDPHSDHAHHDRPGARKSCTHPVVIETDITRFHL